MNPRWHGGNRIELLENGENFFPRVFQAIEQARREVFLETFILFEDKVGLQLHKALITAAKQGAQVEVTVDGYGSPDLSIEFIAALTEAGVRLRIFDGRRRFLGLRTNLFRRLHRKLVVVDGQVAFVGGINFSADHLLDFGPAAKQDYAVRLEGPIVQEIRAFVAETITLPEEYRQRIHRPRRLRKNRSLLDLKKQSSAAVMGAQVCFVVRDNDRHRNAIEQHYRDAIRAARRELIIANAYFFPGHRLLKEIRDAAQRGVRVSLILQGDPDVPWVMSAARLLYRYLLSAGVRIHEYAQRPFHGKVAIADEDWATVGSSNLDPLSLALNLEANVVIRDADFTRQLRDRLYKLLDQDCACIELEQVPSPTFWRRLLGLLAFHVLRHFPAWAGLLPAHTPRLDLVQPPSAASSVPAEQSRF